MKPTPETVEAGKMSSQQERMNRRAVWLLIALGVVMSVGLASISFAWSNTLDASNMSLRPIRLVTWIFIGLSGLALGALYVAVTGADSSLRLVWLIAIFAIGFRLILLLTAPILEVDYYRYIWDGIVCNEGVSPYRFSPTQVLTAAVQIENPQLAQVVDLSTRSEAIHEIASRVHYPDYTTIYPPVSQAVFASAMRWVPSSASVGTYVLVMKSVLVAFDLATLAVLVGMLRLTRMHLGWSVGYAWSPLVIKEIANSGHLDSIVVFFSTAAVYCLMRWLAATQPTELLGPVRGHLRWLFSSAGLLATGIGAKLFPVILLPLFFVVVAKQSFRQALAYCLVVGALTGGLLLPMAIQIDEKSQQAAAGGEVASEGLTSFLKQWRMNDVLFSLVYENTKPNSDEDLSAQLNRAWFVVVPNGVRIEVDRRLSGNRFAMSPSFLAARIVTVAAFALTYLWLVVRVWRDRAGPESVPRFAFVVIATFFFLQPTQNPWYWLWAMPFVCFCPNRGWLLAGGCLFVYYFRFWYKFHGGGFEFAAISYEGVGCFDMCIVWLEYLPLVIACVGWSFACPRPTIGQNDA